jgi:hypothetical protein
MNLIDRARIERTVWTLDTYVQVLPGRTRRAIRQELRANLVAGAADGGAREAIRRLGSLRRLAVDYVDNEYGDRPRPRWLHGALWTLTVEIVIMALAFVGHDGFRAGIEAANPRPDGDFTWTGLSVLGIGGDATYVDGRLDRFGLTFALWNLAYLLAALVLGGRLWRLPGAWWRARRRAVHDVAVG